MPLPNNSMLCRCDTPHYFAFAQLYLSSPLRYGTRLRKTAPLLLLTILHFAFATPDIAVLRCAFAMLRHAPPRYAIAIALTSSAALSCSERAAKNSLLRITATSDRPLHPLVRSNMCG